ncbi:uncharacterized protein LOC131592511 isoform X2 [Poecile atricapillus]|uniref:uncharacterized protein LOC131592511 isoform X2 n=1 Tax=Poecile atricapillus TaxID=48891 RepID=UPI00273894CF|nr:uncharacterized protein LOC131592511 isoform X2 [Poecile atricapillus]
MRLRRCSVDPAQHGLVRLRQGVAAGETGLDPDPGKGESPFLALELFTAWQNPRGPAWCPGPAQGLRGQTGPAERQCFTECMLICCQKKRLNVGPGGSSPARRGRVSRGSGNDSLGVVPLPKPEQLCDCKPAPHKVSRVACLLSFSAARSASQTQHIQVKAKGKRSWMLFAQMFALDDTVLYLPLQALTK